MDNKKRFFFYLKPEILKIIFVFIFVLIYVAAQLSQPYLIGRALDYAIALDGNKFVLYIVICGILAVAGVIMGYLFENFVGLLTQNIIKKIRDDLYQKINSISVSDLFKETKGNIVQYVIGDVENVSNGINAVFKSLIEGVLTVLITIMMMLMINWVLAVGVVVLTPLSVVVSRFIANSSHKYFKKQAKLQSDLSAISLEGINNLDLVQSMNDETVFTERYKEKNEILRKEGTVALFSACWVNPSTRFVNNTIYAIIGVLGIIMYATKCFDGIGASISIGGVASFLAYTNQYTKPFNEISGVVSDYESAKFSFDRINKFLNNNDFANEGKTQLTNVETIQFDHMDFSYDENVSLINDFNLKINKGQKVAIVGPTGAGKTTLINVLLNFYSPLKGDIKFNGISYKDISKESLLSNFGMVLQETWIFEGTVLENIKYAKPNATMDEVNEACKFAHVDSFISTLPQGFNTRIGGKDGLSEGQKQMLSIARAVLANPEIYILDEATSNIDTRSELLITEAFDKIMKNKTTIVIAHRLSTIRKSDIILVLKDGKIIETGNHESLMKAKGFYYQMYSTQQ